MPNATVNQGVRIEYETIGERGARPLLLIKGVGQQMITWSDDFCRLLAQAGHYVIRFDHRDVGLSSRFDQAKTPELAEAIVAVARGETVTPPYTLDDMVGDALGLLDALGIDRAHVCGMSMGGTLAQLLAISHPERLLSLTLIMSGSGSPDAPPVRPDALALLAAPPPSERPAYIEHHLKVFRALSGPGFPFDEAAHRDLAGRLFDRGFYPQGMTRHFLALLSQGDRKPALAHVKLPSLVIHGQDDPLVPVEAGQDLARSIPGAEILIIPGMGHDLPRQAWPAVVEAITKNTSKA